MFSLMRFEVADSWDSVSWRRIHVAWHEVKPSKVGSCFVDVQKYLKVLVY